LLRRALSVAFAAASLALIPATASATPEPAPVENYMFTQYYGTAEAVLADGRTVEISLMEDRSTGPEVRAFLSVLTYREAPCQWGPGTCQTDFASGSVQLSAEQVDFEPSLRGASVTDVPVTIVRYAFGPNGYTQVEEHVTISVVLTGTGSVTRDAYHGTMCGDGSRECQSIRVESARVAVSEVTFGGETVSGEGRLFRGHSVDAAAPKFDYAEN
jgi:hypothetical protein